MTAAQNAVRLVACVCQVVLVALPGVDIQKIEAEVQAQCDALPRNEVARQALSHSCIVMAASKVRCMSRPRCFCYIEAMAHHW